MRLNRLSQIALSQKADFMKHTSKDYPQSYYGLLSILTLGPQSGYDIRKALECPEMFYWMESYGNIYPMLRVLEKDGLIDKRDSYVKSKKRVIYQLNGSGWQELNAWLTEPVRLNRFRVEILMKLRFGASCGVSNMMEHIEGYRKVSEHELEFMKDRCDRLRESDGSLVNDLRLVTSLFLVHLKESALIWCDESMEILEKWKDNGFDPDGILPENAANIENASSGRVNETNVVSLPTRIVPLIE